jgi:hypothetical protein
VFVSLSFRAGLCMLVAPAALPTSAPRRTGPLGQGGRRGTRHQCCVGEQCPAARSCGGALTAADRSEQANLRALGDARLRVLVDSYVDAWERGDTAAILATLAEDATFSMPPHPRWYRGLDDIGAFLPRGPLTERWRLVPLRVNGQLAFGCYRWDSPRRGYLAHSVDVLTLRGGAIAEIAAFHTDGSLRQFGLPDRWSAG